MKQKITYIPTLAVMTTSILLAFSLFNSIALPGKTRPPVTPSAIESASEKSGSKKTEAAYGKLPLSFEPNLGQSDSRVKFLSRGSGYTLFLTSNEAVLSLSNSAERRSGKPTIESNASTADVLRIALCEASASPVVSGLEQLSGTTNYFIGNDPEKWLTNVPTYGKVKYEQVYSGIDLVYYGNQRQLEYDFVVAPGADLNAIRFRVEGIDQLELDARGDLVFHAAGGQIVQREPVVYQELNGGKQLIQAHYLLGKDNVVGFGVAEYDRGRPLIIDPVLSYSTYLGGNGGDSMREIVVDGSGNAYVAGGTTSTDFPIAAGVQPSPSGGFEACVSKLNASGSALVYSTYLGGSGDDFGTCVAIDSSGNAYVTGDTQSFDFPTTVGAFQTTFGGRSACVVSAGDAFVVKLNPTGAALVYSTYLGGSNNEQGNSIRVDSSGNAYVLTGTCSTDFPTTAGAFQTTFGGVSDGTLSKLNATGSALIYSTYIGGGGIEFARSIDLDASGNVYASGSTNSTDYPVTAGAFQTSFTGGGGEGDVFVTKLNATGSALDYSTYLGGSDEEQGNDIAIDAAGNAYVVGSTRSTDFPTASALQASNNGGVDMYLTKLNVVGSAPVYSTYLGGSGFDQPNGVAVDASGNAYLACGTTSTDILVVNPVQAANAGGQDVYVAKVDAAGTAVLFSTYLGGTSNEFAYATAVDNIGGIYLTGDVGSTDFPTAGPLQVTFGGGGTDAFVAKIAPDNQLTSLDPARVWIGLKNSDDVGTKFDLLAEVFKNGGLMGSGQLDGVPGGSSGFNNAVLRTINMAVSSPVNVGPGDTLSIRLSVRIAVGVSGHRSGTARLWFNDAAANSRFGATIGGATNDYFLLGGFALGTAPGAGPKKTIDVFVDRAAGGNPFKPFGTWSKMF